MKSTRILVCEDSITFREEFEDIFTNLKVTSKTTSNIKELLLEAQTAHYDIALLDLQYDKACDARIAARKLKEMQPSIITVGYSGIDLREWSQFDRNSFDFAANRRDLLDLYSDPREYNTLRKLIEKRSI